MKYVIGGSEFEPCIVIGIGRGVLHAELAKSFVGRPKGAGHMRIVNGKVEVFGKSIGYDIEAKEEDAEIIGSYLGLHEHIS